MKAKQSTIGDAVPAYEGVALRDVSPVLVPSNRCPVLCTEKRTWRPALTPVFHSFSYISYICVPSSSYTACAACSRPVSACSSPCSQQWSALAPSRRGEPFGRSCVGPLGPGSIHVTKFWLVVMLPLEDIGSMHVRHDAFSCHIALPMGMVSASRVSVTICSSHSIHHAQACQTGDRTGECNTACRPARLCIY